VTDPQPKARAESTPKTKPAANPSRAETQPAKSSNRSTEASRCSDILQKASLEALSREESEYLKRECR
jgi:hypothetical protein